MPATTNYKNMANHSQWDVSAEWFKQFEDIERLKLLNRMLSRDRVSKNFTTETYKQFIKKFYYDEQFNAVYDDYIAENKSKYAMPSLDHVIPLARGGTWELQNLQIISWAENRAKCDFMPEEWAYIKKKYFMT